MLNALVENTNRRFIGRTTTLNEPQDADSAYQKLSVFKQLPVLSISNSDQTLEPHQRRVKIPRGELQSDLLAGPPEHRAADPLEEPVAADPADK